MVTPSLACTNACTSLPNSVEDSLERFAADLRSLLTADDCRRLAELLMGRGRESLEPSR